ncbi:MAG: tRNA (uridine(54)-C5)-methyltransferase TrmA, partial [Sulfurospirillum sp.]
MKIYTLMPKLLKQIESSPMLREKIFAIEFLASSEHLLVTLIYHKPLNEVWESEAKELEKAFGIFIIGRSRGIKRVLSQDFVEDRFDIADKTYRYHIIEGGFSQPNR